MRWFEALYQDFRYGGRLLRREPVLAGLMLLVLALGIGGNTAVFSLLNAVLLRPLPYGHAERLATLEDSYGKLSVAAISPTIPEFIDLRDRNHVFESMAFLDHRDMQITGGEHPERVYSARVTASFFEVLGVTSALGRTFRHQDNQPGSEKVVILSADLWRQNFAADPAVIGRQVGISGVAHTVVGVLPRGFAFDYPSLGIPEKAQIYVPYVLDDYYTLRSGEFSNVRRVRTLVRLKQGSDLKHAGAELDVLAQSLVREHPDLYRGPKGEDTGFRIKIRSLQDAIAGDMRTILTLLVGAVSLVLLIACANTAQFFLARALQREREVAIRAAVGADRARLIRQFLTESLVIALAGGALGIVLSQWLVIILVKVIPAHNPLLDVIHVDWRVLTFTLALSMMTTVLFGLIPAIRASKPQSNTGGGGGRSTRRGNYIRHALVAAEVALSAILLVAASLLLHALLRIESAPPGFNSDRVIAMQVALQYYRASQIKPTASIAYQRYLAQISSAPGVVSAAIMTGLPLRSSPESGFTIEGQEQDLATLMRQRASIQIVSPDYFRTLQIPVLEGRTLSDADTLDRPRVAIVNRELARRFWPDTTPLGKHIWISTALTVVGVVGDVKMQGLQTSPIPQIYTSYLQNFEPNMNLVVRTVADPAQVFGHIKNAIWSVDPEQAVFNVQSMDQVVSNSTAEPQFNTWLIGSFAVLALVMAISGVYTVVSYLVSQRTHEIATRMALGAHRVDVLWLVTGHTLCWTALGLLVGSASAVVLVRLSPILPGLSTIDPASIVTVTLFFLATVAVATYIPASRATRLDPAAVLRSE